MGSEMCIRDRYYHTDEAVQHNKGSTGLGLAIVRHVARTHGIKINVENIGNASSPVVMLYVSLPEFFTPTGYYDPSPYREFDVARDKPAVWKIPPLKPRESFSITYDLSGEGFPIFDLEIKGAEYRKAPEVIYPDFTVEARKPLISNEFFLLFIFLILIFSLLVIKIKGYPKEGGT